MSWKKLCELVIIKGRTLLASLTSEPPLAPFAFWTGEGRELLAPFEKEWTDAFPTFRIYEEADVIPLLQRYAPERLDVFDAIRFPAGRSDVARYILLYEYGGLYVDCHVGLERPDEVRSLLEALGGHDGIFIDRVLSFLPREVGEHFVISSIIFGRAGWPFFLELFHRALENLDDARRLERTHGRSGVTTWTLCGPLLLNQVLGAGPIPFRAISADLGNRIRIIAEEEAPMVRNRYRAQSLPGQHWSERAKTEHLFAT